MATVMPKAAEAQQAALHTLREEFLSLCLTHKEVSPLDWREGWVGPPTHPPTHPPQTQGIRDEQLQDHFADRYLQLVPIINSCLAEVSLLLTTEPQSLHSPTHPPTHLPKQQNRIRCMKTETNELVYQAMDPDLAEKMKNLG